MAEYSGQVEFIEVVGFKTDARRTVLSNLFDPDFAYYYTYLAGRLILDGRAVGVKQAENSFSGLVGTLSDATLVAPPAPAITAQVAFTGIVGTGVSNTRRAVLSNLFDPDSAYYYTYLAGRLILNGRAVGIKQAVKPFSGVVGLLGNATSRSTKFTANAPTPGTTAPPISGRVLAISTTPFTGTTGTLKDSALVKIVPGFIFAGTVGTLTQGRISGYPGFSFPDIFDTPSNTRTGGHLTFNRRVTRNYAKQ